MRILHFCPHSGGVMYEWHQVHFLDELKRSGHKITDCNPVEVLKRVGTTGEYSNILVDAAKNALNDSGPHILFATATDSTLEPGAVDYIRKLGMICINLSVDDLVVPFQVRKIGAHFDLHWTTFIGADEHLKKYGCKVIYMPMAANPYFFKPYSKHRSQILCFVGSRYGARLNYLAALIKAGLPVKIRGAGWLEGSISDSKAKGTCSSTINFKQLRMAGEFMRLATGRKIIVGWHKKKISDMFGKYDTSVGLDWDASGPLATFEEMVDLLFELCC